MLPFGLTNWASHLSGCHEQVIQPNKYNADGTENPMHTLSKAMLVFIDDILIFSNTAEEHRKHIDIVLQLLSVVFLYMSSLRRLC